MTAWGLWAIVVAFGAYHGLNPAMGWPLAVANGLAEQRGTALMRTLVPLGAGHLAAMSAALLPFALLAPWLAHAQAVRAAAGAAVLAFGLYRLLQRRHPRALARIPPTRLAWWSFAMASAHGAGLMLAPIALGLCGGAGSGHAAALDTLMRGGIATAVAIALVHTVAMLLAAFAIAWGVYRWLGLTYLRRMWMNLDAVWGSSLAVAGAATIAGAWA